jgi:hypothetical protein
MDARNQRYHVCNREKRMVMVIEVTAAYTQPLLYS